MRPGDTYESVLNLVENTNVEICWDAGHSWRSSLLKKQPPFPAADFLRKVGHVHLHDADGDERGWFDDHRPLDEGRSPWKQYLRMLFSHTYDSPFMLEVTIDSHFCDYEKKTMNGQINYGKVSSQHVILRINQTLRVQSKK
ncbi:MAG: TIM barrel protein [Chitinispirillaceae bacterium]